VTIAPIRTQFACYQAVNAPTGALPPGGGDLVARDVAAFGSSWRRMPVLVTGASGFVGSLLAARLLSDGVAVRALGRDPVRALAAVEQLTDAEDLEVVRGDPVMGEGLDRALAGVEVAYYLIHSMETVPAGRAPFTERERVAAENFAAAAARAGVRRIVYLGGLVPGPSGDGNGAEPDGGRPARASRHLASREEVEGILTGAVSDSVALRASIVIGARSRSFRLLVRLVERMPVLTLPAWRRFRTQPIDQRDVIAMLVAAAHAPIGGRTLDIAGPDVLTYGEMLTRIADLMMVSRPALGLSVNMTGVAARVAAAIVREDPELVLPLMEGLAGDLLARDHHADELLGVRLHTFDAAVERAFAEWEEVEPLAAR
jgi:uncharacterized protein YbjT (DUF2867 family)